MISEERRGSVTVVTIERPERRNAVDRDALEGLASAIAASVAREDRVLVLRGAGGNFCAGADLTGVEDAGFAAVLRTVLDGLAAAPVVTLAAVDGAALGAGTQLAAFCDLRTATAGARFGIPAGRLGLMVDHGTVRRVVSLAGGGAARAMLLAAEQISGDDAYRLGLVQRVCGVDDAVGWATEIAALAPLTLRGHKLMVEDAPAADVAAAFRAAWESTDLAEGIAAFHERRAPEFRGW